MKEPKNIDDLIASAKKELERRKKDYPALIEHEVMSRDQAAFEYRAQDKILRVLQELKRFGTNFEYLF